MSEIIYVLDNNEKRPATSEEIAQLEKDKLEMQEKERLDKIKEDARLEARQLILNRLGLTEEEAKILAGSL